MLSSSVSVSISSFQADPQILKNTDLSRDIPWFLKNQRFTFDDGLESVLGLSWRLFGCSWGRLGSTLGYLEGLLGVSWDPFGDLRSTKKFVLELLMASVELDVFFFFSSLLFWSCFSSFGVVILRIFRICWMSRLMCFFLSENDECLNEIAGFEV